MLSEKHSQCKHDQGFVLRLNPYQEQHQYKLPPAVWNCKCNCGFWLPFDPEFAGTIRVVIDPDEPLDPYSEMFWGNIYTGVGGFAYTSDKEGKTTTFSRSKING